MKRICHSFLAAFLAFSLVAILFYAQVGKKFNTFVDDEVKPIFQMENTEELDSYVADVRASIVETKLLVWACAV